MTFARRLATAAVAVAAITAGAGRARAADTVETWEPGATDIDFYLGLDQLRGTDRTMFADLMLGFGVLSRFSVYLGTTLEGDTGMTQGSADLHMGVFGTPIDTDHLDLDLFLGVSGWRELELAPGMELNFDRDPAMRTWGVYLRAQLPVHGRSGAASPAVPGMERRPTVHIASTLGVYRTVATGHQLLLEYGMDFHPDPVAGQRRIEVGGIALGYNVVLHDRLELITQLYVDLPQANDSVDYGFTAGFIATLPSAG